MKLESAEDAKLSQILNKQRYHQQQLQEQRSSSQQQWNIPTNISPGGDNSNVTETGSPSQPNNRQPVRAWSVHGESSVSSSHVGQQERTGHHLNDLSLQDINSEDYEKRSTSSLLDSESTYLPVEHGKAPVTPNRPMTAPTTSMFSGSVTQHVLDVITRGDNRPATAIGDNKYDAYDRRPIKPMNQDMYKGLYKPDFHVSQPQISGNMPVQGAKKKVPPTAQAMDYDTSQDASQMDQILNPPNGNEENIPTEELSLLREALAKKASRKNSQKLKSDSPKTTRATERKRDKSDIGVSKHEPSVQLHSGAKTSIPVASKSTVSRTQSEYVPGKYSSSRRPGTADSGKTKTIKNIPENMIGKDRVKNDGKRDQNSSLLDSGIYSRPNSDAVLADDVRAATKIQSFWRGYYTREHDVDAVRVRREIRARRAEEHIVVLRTELDKQRRLYEQEKQLRTLQLEAIRHLWKEVQSLQSWKNEVLQSQTFISVETKREHEYNSYNSSLEIQNTLARAEMLNRMSETDCHGNSVTLDTSKQRELEKTCLNLQMQVSQLQEALKSVSSLVLQSSAGSLSTGSLNTGTLGTGALQPESVSSTPRAHTNTVGTSKGTVPHSLSPYPSEEEEAYFKTVPQPGFPTPPRGLRLENRGASALVLRWQASKILDGDGREINKPLLGYRVFVNDKAKAMIAGTKQKALIEGLDVSLTYKIYVKAVSDLGESNSSDVIMAALAKGARRRSSSTDSNRSYDSDHESTESDRRSHRRDHRKNRKSTKSPKTAKHEKVERSEPSHNEPSTAKERPMSKMELEAEGIMTQPRLHTHRRNRSKDYKNKGGEETLNNLKPKETPQSPVMRSPKLSSQESQGFSFDSRNKGDHDEVSQSNLSSTFTIDSQNSVLFAMSSKNLDSLDSAADVKDEGSKGHRRRRSKDLNKEKIEGQGNVSDSSSSVSSLNVVSRNVDVAGERSGTDSPSASRRRRSKDNTQGDSDTGSLYRSDSITKRNSAKISPTAGSQGVPVIDGRRRHGSGSRPSSPAHSDISDSRSSVGATDRRRMPMADLLEQRFSTRSQSGSSINSSTATLTQSQADQSVNDLPPPIPKREGKYPSLENLSTRSSHEYNRSPTERQSPTTTESTKRRRTSSTCSENDIPVASSAARQLDLDSKGSGSSGNGGIVAKLLQKLQTFSKSQEESLRTTKYKRKPGESEELPRKASGDSDISEPLTGHAPVHSDSSGAHSDDSQQVTRPSYRTHRRTASDHRGVPVKVSEPPSPSPGTSRPDHSPVIMDTKSSASSSSSANNIKRHASFHGILPSKKEDLVRSGSSENLAEKVSSVKQQNIAVQQ